MRDNRLSTEGSAESIVITAGKAIGWEKDKVELYLSKPALHLDSAEPACVFKGNQNGTGKGSIVAWAHLFGLNPEFSEQCPVGLRKDVVEHINTHREGNPKVKPTPNIKQNISKDADSRKLEHPNGAATYAEKTVEVGKGKLQVSDISRNTTFAELGRVIVEQKGKESRGSRITEGQAGYKISVNITDNTMRIYSRKSGKEPILVDANGKIDHKTAKVSQEDIDHFERVVQSLKSIEKKEGQKRESQMCL